MNEIPDVLLPLVETHEEDGSPVRVCGYPCSETYLMGDLRRVWGAMHRDAENGEITLLSNRSSRKSAACPYCGTLLGFLSDGPPYRIRHSRVVEALEQAEAERDHLRRALEWTIAKMQGCDTYQCPYPCPDGQHGDDGRCMGTLEGCWMIAALAATEEAHR